MIDALERLQNSLSDRYSIEREIGHGGMSVVLLARDLRHDRYVAIKVLRPDLAATLAAERFLREIRIAASLQHPNIVPLYDSGNTEGLLFFVMPYVEGESLRNRLNREKQLPIEDVIQLTSEVADALSFAHSHGIVHRDIKPENILISEGHALVADFGVARAVRQASEEGLTETGLAVGTPAYMSPEQATGSEEIDGRSDIYTLGCVVYEMLSGEPPFTGPSGQAILARQVNERPPSLRVLRPTISVELESTVEKALAKIPADRYRSAVEFANVIAGRSPSGHRAPIAASVRRARTRALGLGAVAVTALIVWRLLASPNVPLNPDTIMIFPLDVSGDVNTQEAELGEDNAYLIQNALAGRVPLKWLCACEEVSLLSGAERGARAREAGAGFYLHGRLMLFQDSVQTVITLHDVAGDSVIYRADSTGSRIEARQMGTRAMGKLLLSLLPEQSVDLSAIAGRRPEAVQSFVAGERSFHAGHFEAAFEFYRVAVEEDSAFAIAAVKAAQAASWLDQPEKAKNLIAVALEHADLLTERRASYARGLAAFLSDDSDAVARSDSAVYWFERAIEIDPDWLEGWVGLGEVYTHLLPRGPGQDSLARDAFARVYGMTNGFAPVLFHLIEGDLRRGDVDFAASLLAEFRRADPDSAALSILELMYTCVTKSPSAIDWPAAVLEDAEAVFQSARWLSVKVANPECAISGWSAVLENDTTERYSFSSLVGVQSLLAATGRDKDLKALLDSAAASGTPIGGAVSTYYIVDAIAGAEVESKARSVAKDLRRGFQAGTLNAPRLWLLGVWDANRGHVIEASAIRDTLRRAAVSGDRVASLTATSMAAHVALAEADTAKAIELLESLSPTATRGNLTWRPWESLGLEWLTLARIYAAREQFDDALRVAGNIDAPGSVANLIFLPASLELRAAAAEKLGNKKLARALASRMERLTR